MNLRSVPQPIGRFRSLTTRDASAQERNGQAIVAWSPLSGGQIEVQFTDGVWMLCAPEELDAGRFTVDGLQPRTWPVARFGSSPDGPLKPVVARAVLDSLLEATRTPHTWESGSVQVGEPRTALNPGEDGMYDLGPLGWQFVQTHDSC